MDDEKLIINVLKMYIFYVRKRWWFLGRFLQHAIFLVVVGRVEWVTKTLWQVGSATKTPSWFELSQLGNKVTLFRPTGSLWTQKNQTCFRHFLPKLFLSQFGKFELTLTLFLRTFTGVPTYSVTSTPNPIEHLVLDPSWFRITLSRYHKSLFRFPALWYQINSAAYSQLGLA